MKKEKTQQELIDEMISNATLGIGGTNINREKQEEKLINFHGNNEDYPDNNSSKPCGGSDLLWRGTTCMACNCCNH